MSKSSEMDQPASLKSLANPISVTEAPSGPKSTGLVFELEDAETVDKDDAPKSPESSMSHLNEELFVPGKVVWIHRVHGHLDAAIVPCDLPSLRRIVFDKRMIEDHTMKQIRSALQCIHDRQTVTAPLAQEVKWQPFCSAGECCPCCGSKFEWSSTARSRKQRWLSMTNCRACGLVVCNDCSQTRRTLPQQGILEPARVCDRCTWRLPGTSRSSSSQLCALGCGGSVFDALC